MIIIIQLILIVGCARVAGALSKRLGQPQVCGEIAAGLVLGPSVFGALWPQAQRMLFDPTRGTHLSILSEVGLIFIMFLIGLEFDFGHLAGSTRSAFSISAAGIILPFSLGIPLGRWIHSQMNLHVNVLGFTLFVATALSITAMPVLGRIMIEFNLNKTKLGALTITAAAVNDAIGWFLLAVVSAVVIAQFHLGPLLLSAAELVAYVLGMIFLVRPLLMRWTRRVMRDSGGELSSNALAQLIVFLLASAAITNAIGVFSVFGAFVMGGILHDQPAFCAAVNNRMRDFVTVLFLPIFFTFTGLRTDIGSLSGVSAWITCAVVILVASTGKFVGCSVAAKLSRLTWREAFSVGTLMNTRGLMELIVLNTGYDLGLIPKPVFCIFVVMAIVTTYMTAPLLRWLIRGTDLQPDFDISPFMQRRTSALRNRADSPGVAGGYGGSAVAVSCVRDRVTEGLDHEHALPDTAVPKSL
jgi:Kef-type K+ transport system membrane component KefB